MPAAGPADRAVGSLSALQGDEEAHHADLRGAVAPHPLHAFAARAPRAAQRRGSARGDRGVGMARRQ